MYQNLVNNYIKKYKCKKFLVDTSFIENKMGIDNISYNKYYPKHKVSKLSLITDIKGAPLNIYLDNGSINDSKLIIKQLELFNNNKFIKKDNNNIFIGDSGYDSNPLRNKLKELELGILITKKNIRNTKNKDKLKKLKLTNKEKKYLSKRYRIELTNNKFKQYKRINIRYDKYTTNFIKYILLAAIEIIIKQL
jgi:transposase